MIGGSNGCTHIRELLVSIATVAFQTIFGEKSRLNREALLSGKINYSPKKNEPPNLLNSCYAYDQKSEITQNLQHNTKKKKTMMYISVLGGSASSKEKILLKVEKPILKLLLKYCRLNNMVLNFLGRPNRGSVPNRYHQKLKTLLENNKTMDEVYFIHSYKAVPSDASYRVADCIYGGHKISAVVMKNNITGCQFHPEKSHRFGKKILANYADLN